MHSIKLLFLLAAGVFIRCSSAPGAVSGGSAGFSSKIDGVDFSSNKSNDHLNTAFHYKNDNGQERLFFMLCDPGEPAKKYNFEVPPALGTTLVKITEKYSYTGFIDKDLTPYDDDGVTVTITTLTATRVAGTFSGAYKAEKGFPKAKPSIQVTEGKFDIPFCTSASWKKFYHAE